MRLENNYRSMDFLPLARMCVIVAHSAGGMVDFKYNGVSHTVRKNTTYKFFEEQYKVSKQLKER